MAGSDAAWDASFEGTPVVTDDSGLDYQQHQNRAVMVRKRGDIEHDWGSAGGAGFTGSGRHSPGSARIYSGATAPTTILRPDGTALVAGDMPTGSGASPTLGANDTFRVWQDTSGYIPVLKVLETVSAISAQAWVSAEPAKNLLINPAFRYFQELGSGATSTGFVTATRRWVADGVYCTPTFTGVQPITQRVSAGLPTGTASPFGFSVTGSDANFTQFELHFVVASEVAQYCRGWMTFSFRVANNCGVNYTPSLRVDTANATDNFTGVTPQLATVAFGTAIATATSRRYAMSFDATGYNANGFVVTIRSSTLNGAGRSLVFSDVMLEPGRSTQDAPGKFRVPDPEEDLSQCQRHYMKTFPIDTAVVQNVGSNTGCLYATTGASNSRGVVNWSFPVRLRQAAPNIITYNPRAAATSWRDTGNTTNLAISTSISSALFASITTATDNTNDVWNIHVSVDARPSI